MDNFQTSPSLASQPQIGTTMDHNTPFRVKLDALVDRSFWVAPVAIPLGLLAIAAFVNAFTENWTQGIEWIAAAFGMIQGASFIPGIRAALRTRVLLAVGYLVLMPFLAMAFFHLASVFFAWLMPPTNQPF